MSKIDILSIRKKFPILHQKVNGKPLVYFDNAATAQKPLSVIVALNTYYTRDNANIHRAAHTLAARSTEMFEDTRKTIQAFINAREVEECIFTKGVTESINLVAQTWGRKFLQAGDEVLSINGVKVTDWYNDVKAIRNSGGKTLSLEIKRGSQTLSILATPTLEQVDGKPRWILGIINKVGLKRTNPITAFKSSALVTRDFISASVKSLGQLPSKIPSLWGQSVGGQKRDANGLVGVVGVARASGQAVGSGKLSPAERLATFILIIASLNIFVGIFNLLPLLPLDGGHMAVAIADEIRAFFARLRGRPRPSAIDVTILTPVTMVVFVLLAALTLLLLFADIVNPVNLNL